MKKESQHDHVIIKSVYIEVCYNKGTALYDDSNQSNSTKKRTVSFFLT